MSLDVIFQIFTGGWKNRLYSAGEICRKLDKIFPEIFPKAVIMGWNLESNLYTEVIDFLHRNGVRAYLWLPVFSETGELAEADPAFTLTGHRMGGVKLQEGESFEFYCPSSSKNFVILQEIYNRFFAESGFDGAFLDKIRSASMIGGAGEIFGCCCPECVTFLKQKGVDLEKLKAYLEKGQLAELMEPMSFSPTSGFTFRTKVMEDFLYAKCQLYASRTGQVISWFKKRGLKTGLDIFAPALCRLVGQSLESLVDQVDFIKPMMYRRTKAPAGMEYEYQAVKTKLNDGEMFDEAIRRAGFQNGMDSDELMGAQLEGYPEEIRRKLFPGLEVNNKKGIVEVEEDYIENSLRIIRKSGCGGAVLSWDIMQSSLLYMKAAGRQAKIC